ncbi:MAG: hypothetical protein AAGG80_05700 [Pseudomonadota bacterium]
MKYLGKFSFLGLLLLCLVACVPTAFYQQTDNHIDNISDKIAYDKANYGNYGPAVIDNKGIYADTRPIAIKPIPLWEKRNISIHGKNLPFSFYMARILNGTGMDVSYQNNRLANKTISMNYSGRIKGALDYLAAKTGYAYTANGHDLIWSDMITQTFDISFMPGNSTYLVGGQGTRAQNNSNSNVSYFGELGNSGNEYSNLSGNLSLWADLNKTLEELKSKDGKVIVSEATTTVTVYDHPANVAMMAKFLKHLNKELSRQVALQVQVVEVELNKNFNYGIDWNLAYREMNIQFGVQGSLSQPVAVQPLGNNPSTSTAAGFIINAVNEASKWNGTNILINALKQQGKVSVETEPRVVTLNNQVAEIGINRLQGYLKEVTNTVTGGVGQFSQETLTPGIVKTGFSLYLLPKIEGHRVYLQISSSLSRLETIQTIRSSSEATANTIQVPTVNDKLFNQRSLVNSGATLVIAGFKQLSHTANKISFFGVQTSEGAEKRNIETILLITPTIIEQH